MIKDGTVFSLPSAKFAQNKNSESRGDVKIKIPSKPPDRDEGQSDREPRTSSAQRCGRTLASG